MKASQRPFACRKARALLRLYRNALPKLLGEPDEQSFGAADVAEPIRVLVLHHVANELRAARAEPGERRVDVVHGEHDAQVAERDGPYKYETFPLRLGSTPHLARRCYCPRSSN